MTPKEAAEYANVKFGILMQAAKRGTIGTFNMGTGQYSFTTNELDTWLASLPAPLKL